MNDLADGSRGEVEGVDGSAGLFIVIIVMQFRQSGFLIGLTPFPVHLLLLRCLIF